METHIDGTIYGDTYRGNNVWRFIEGTMYGDPYKGDNEWRLI